MDIYDELFGRRHDDLRAGTELIIRFEDDSPFRFDGDDAAETADGVTDRANDEEK